MATITRLFLARHAAPENPRGVFYGHLPGFSLGPEGERQALGLGDYISLFPVRQAYSSPLERAVETATLALSRLPYSVPVNIREDLVEASFGRYIEGVPRPQVPLRRPLFLVHLLRPGALAFDETVATMADRVDRVLVEALQSCAGEAALVVSHADPVKAFWNRHLGRADWRFHGLPLKKGAFLELSYENNRLVEVKAHSPRHPPG